MLQQGPKALQKNLKSMAINFNYEKVNDLFIFNILIN